jgi:RNA polymerase sigma factor (TIGR02999 family)
MSDLTRILGAIERGEPQATGALLPLVYEELRRPTGRKLAQEQAGQTLQATTLVHESYRRLVDPDDPPRWGSRRHYFAAAAEAMRRILIDRARDRNRIKRGGGRARQAVDLETILHNEADPDDLLDVDDALTRLAVVDPQATAVVKLRLFAGMTVPVAADHLGTSLRTAERDLTFARTWLFGQLNHRSQLGS